MKIKEVEGRNVIGGVGVGEPAVSVILVVEDSLNPIQLHASIASLRTQSYLDFELLIVSADPPAALAEEIEWAAAMDDRIIPLGSPLAFDNPAAMAVLGLQVSRAPRKVIASGHAVFDCDALVLLHRELDHRNADFVVGGVDSLDDPNTPMAPWQPEELWYQQSRPLDAVMFKAGILKQAGFPDPRLVFRDIWTWDFLRRMAVVGLGVSMAATVVSLRRSLPQVGVWHPLAPATFRHSRFATLHPDAVSEVDLWGCDDAAPLEERLYAQEAARQHRHAMTCRDLPPPPAPPAAPPAAKSQPAAWSEGTIVVVGYPDATVSLLFDGLPDHLHERLVIVSNIADADCLRSIIVRAAMVCMIRHIQPSPVTDEVVRLARLAEVPLYYILDDNFPFLAQERTDLAWYTIENLRERLASFAGVMVTSGTLFKYFQEQPIHNTMELWQPILNERLIARTKARAPANRKKGPLRIGCFGGLFRGEHLNEVIVPALRQVSSNIPLVLCLRESMTIQSSTLNIEYMPFHKNFSDFIDTWHHADIDIIIHPAGTTNNIDYKTKNAVLCSHYIGAVPVLPGEVAYKDIRETDGAIVVQPVDRVERWVAALIRAADPKYRDIMLNRLGEYCLHTFSPEPNTATLEAIIARDPGCTPWLRERRWHKITTPSRLQNEVTL